MPIKRLFIVYLFWIKFCLSVRLRDCSLVHSLSIICYLRSARPLSSVFSHAHILILLVYYLLAAVEASSASFFPAKSHTRLPRQPTTPRINIKFYLKRRNKKNGESYS